MNDKDSGDGSQRVLANPERPLANADDRVDLTQWFWDLCYPVTPWHLKRARVALRRGGWDATTVAVKETATRARRATHDARLSSGSGSEVPATQWPPK